MEKTIEEEFKEILKDIQLAYLKNFEEKKDSWRKLSPFYLDRKFREELKEYDKTDELKDSYQEMIDVLLVGLMLANSLKGGLNSS